MVEQKHEEWAAQLLDPRAGDESDHDTVEVSPSFAHFRFESNEALTHFLFGRESSDAVADAAQMSRTRARLLANLASEARFAPFYAELCRHFALALDALRGVLQKIDDRSSWQAAPIPGVGFFHFAPGAGSGFAEAGIVKLAKGARFPMHQHLGDEVNFVLEGTLIDGGISYGPGSAIVRAAGTSHDYSAGSARDLVLVAGHNGISYLP